MVNKNSFFAVIPARAGSKGIPNKNLQLIGEKPMIQFTMEAALQSSQLDSVIVTTDDKEIIKLAHSLGIKAPFTRPATLSTDTAKTSDVLLHALDWYKEKNNVFPENIVLLQPTSPFRTFDDVDKAILQFRKSEKNNLISVCESMQHPNDCMVQDENGNYRKVEIGITENSRHTGRQSYCETVFIDGAIYISSVKSFLETHDLIGNEPDIITLHQSHSIDIDTVFDLDLARSMYKSGMLTSLTY